jgi:membrane-associated protein
MSAFDSLQVDSVLSYLIAFLIPALDAIFPALPGESAIIALGVATAGSADPRIALLIGCAAAGAFIGDNLSYLLGRRFGPAVERRFFTTPKGMKARAWAERSLDKYGTQLIVVCRFIPGGRTAVTLTCGITGYPRRRFVAATAVAAVIWALYAFFIGRIGGQAFEDNPWAGLVIAFGASIAISALIEVIRRLLARRRRRASAEAARAEGRAGVFGLRNEGATNERPRDEGKTSASGARRRARNFSASRASRATVPVTGTAALVRDNALCLCCLSRRHAGQVEPDHAGQDQGDRDELHGRGRVAEEDHADRRGPRGADPGPYRVGGTDLKLAQRDGQQPEADQRG